MQFCNDFVNKGYIIITNIKSYANFLGNERSVYIRDIMEIIERVEKNEFISKNFIIFYDEIFTAIEKSRLPKKILSFLSQMRKRNLIMITTCQEWLELNVTMRRYVRFQIECNMWGLPITKTAFVYNQINDATKMKWSNLENEYVCPVIQTNFSKGLKEVINSYDTFETIETGT